MTGSNSSREKDNRNGFYHSVDRKQTTERDKEGMSEMRQTSKDEERKGEFGLEGEREREAEKSNPCSESVISQAESLQEEPCELGHFIPM